VASPETVCSRAGFPWFSYLASDFYSDSTIPALAQEECRIECDVTFSFDFLPIITITASHRVMVTVFFRFPSYHHHHYHHRIESNPFKPE
jgi:hypothetical protein